MNLYQRNRNAEMIALVKVDPIMMNDKIDSRPMPDNPWPLQNNIMEYVNVHNWNKKDNSSRPWRIIHRH